MSVTDKKAAHSGHYFGSDIIAAGDQVAHRPTGLRGHVTETDMDTATVLLPRGAEIGFDPSFLEKLT